MPSYISQVRDVIHAAYLEDMRALKNSDENSSMNHIPLVTSDLKTTEIVTVPPNIPVASRARLLAEAGSLLRR